MISSWKTVSRPTNSGDDSMNKDFEQNGRMPDEISGSKKRRKYQAASAAAFFLLLSVLFILPAVSILAAGTPSKVKKLKVKGVDFKTVSVTFKAASNAKKYEIYRAKKKDGKFRKIKTVKKTSVKISGLKAGKIYYFKVRGINGNGAGKFSKTVSGHTKLQTPEVNAATDPAGIMVTWNKIPGAKGYDIYRKAPGGSRTLIKTILKRNTVSFRDVNVMNLKQYRYYVTALNGPSSSSRSQTAAAFYYAVPESAVIKPASIEEEGIVISWERSAEADNYGIFRKKHGTADPFARILNVTYENDSAVDRSALPGQNYDYYVVAENHGIAAKASGTVTAGILKYPDIRLKLDENGVTLTWDPVKEASGYEVYKIDKKGVCTLAAEYDSKTGSRLASENTISADKESGRFTYAQAFTPSNGKKYIYGVKAIRKDPGGVFESRIKQRYSYFVSPPKKLTVYYANDSILTIGFKINKKANGQIVQLSENTDFSGCREITINNLFTYLGTLDGLEPEKKYYVRARNFITEENGNIYFSIWSKAYKAYTKPVGLEEGKRIDTEAENETVEKAISWIDGRISVLDTATAKVLGAAAWKDDDHFSCSSLITKGYIHAGVDLPTWFFSSAVAKNYLAHGFTEVTKQVNIKTGAGLKRGDVLLNKKESHTGMYLGYYRGRNKMMINATKKHWTTKYNGASYSWKRVFRYTGE